MKILIVDDELVSRKKMDLLVRSLGHETLVASDGVEGWEAWKKERARMVITDWMMPRMDGLELCRRIREAERSQYIYIIMVTSREGFNFFNIRAASAPHPEHPTETTLFTSLISFSYNQ